MPSRQSCAAETRNNFFEQCAPGVVEAATAGVAVQEDEGDADAEPSAAVAASSAQSCLGELGPDDRSASPTHFRMCPRGSPPRELG
eukprot:4191774-Alexandrium_andersonii.AAC.1